MAAPSVTYTFSNQTSAEAGDVNQNFTDIINGISDGTKDLSVNSITTAGSQTYNGLTASRGVWTNASKVLASVGLDNAKQMFGTGSDASIYYDGTNLVVDPKEVGSGVLSVAGGVTLEDDINLSVGKSILWDTSGMSILYTSNVGNLDVSAGTLNLGVGGGAELRVTTGVITTYGTFTTTAGTLFEAVANQASPWQVRNATSAVNYLGIVTTTGSEHINIGNSTDNPDITLWGSGNITLPQFAGTGNRFVYADNSGILQEGGLIP